DPFPAPAEQLGSGTLMGMAVALGAPWCDLLLVRVDPAAPHHLALIERRLHGDEFFSESLQQRRFDLLQGREFLTQRRLNLARERLEILKTFPDDKQSDDPITKRKQAAQEEYRKKQVQFDTEEKAYL